MPEWLSVLLGAFLAIVTSFVVHVLIEAWGERKRRDLQEEFYRSAD